MVRAARLLVRCARAGRFLRRGGPSRRTLGGGRFLGGCRAVRRRAPAGGGGSGAGGAPPGRRAPGPADRGHGRGTARGDQGRRLWHRRRIGSRSTRDPRQEIQAMTQPQPNPRPLLAGTLGDVAGIGPEITAKMLMGHDELRQKARLLVVGDVDVMIKAVKGLGGDAAIVRKLDRAADCTNTPGTIEVLQAGPSLAHVKLGEISADAGDGSVRFVTTACALARAGDVAGARRRR
ncbi:hypothetical protein G6F57_017183 [Rhizopus arrhizus]|nr:hypothetical protein G6F57_017183 [Rhizopus arrhizus]